MKKPRLENMQSDLCPSINAKEDFDATQSSNRERKHFLHKKHSKVVHKNSSLRMRSKRWIVKCQNGEVGKGAIDLPSDIVCEILSRLPIEAILQCRSVCKAWYSLTLDPEFISLQLSRSNNQPPRAIIQPLSTSPYSSLKSSPSVAQMYAQCLILLDTEDNKARRIPLVKIPISYYELQIMCSCNGLLCIASDNKRGPLFICNPMIGEFRKLPSSAKKGILISQQVGIGFHASSQKYKVVRAYKYKNKSHAGNGFQIITSGVHSWRELKPPQDVHEFDIGRAVFWNNALHWKISKKVGKFGGACILSFDFSDEKFQVISFPDTIEDCERNLELLVLDGCLTLVELKSSVMKLWKVTGDKVGDFSLCCQQIFDTHVLWRGDLHCSLKSVLDFNDYLLKVSYSTSITPRSLRSHFVHYSPEEKPLIGEYLHVNIPSLPDHFEAFPYNPSLVSVNHWFASTK